MHRVRARNGRYKINPLPFQIGRVVKSSGVQRSAGGMDLRTERNAIPLMQSAAWFAPHQPHFPRLRNALSCFDHDCLPTGPMLNRGRYEADEFHLVDVTTIRRSLMNGLTRRGCAP